MFMRVIASLFMIIAASAPTLADNQNVTDFALNNGLQVVVIEDHRAPIVTHMVWYRVGSADEIRGKSGIAHFLEHLMFKGTESMASGEFSDIVAANGGSENAFTSYDYTGYYQRVAADRLPLMMQLEADRMRNLLLPPEEVLPELDVVLEERNARVENNPSALFGEQRRAALYMNHPYGVPVIGWKHEVAQLTQEDAIAFYQTYYAPNNAILIVAGDVTPEEVRVHAQEHYGGLQPSDTIPKRLRPQEPPHLSPIRLSFSDPRVRQPYVIRNYLAPSRRSGDQKEAAALTLLAELLGGSGVTSVIGQKLQLEQKIAINSGAFYDGKGLDPESFGIYAVPVPGVTLQDIETATDQVISEFLAEGVDPDHLARLKTQIRAAQIYARDSQDGLARRYGEALTTGLTVQDVQDWPDILAAVSAEDIMAAAHKLFDLNQSVTGWLMAGENQ